MYIYLEMYIFSQASFFRFDRRPLHRYNRNTGGVRPAISIQKKESGGNLDEIKGNAHRKRRIAGI